MKTLVPILMVVAMTAGCGTGSIDAKCDDSYEHFCDASVLYLVDLCGNSIPMGHCEFGCNVEFNACQGKCSPFGPQESVVSASKYAPAEVGGHEISSELQGLPQVGPIEIER